MKYIQFYQRNKISEKDVFDSLINSLKSSIKAMASKVLLSQFFESESN